MSLQTKVIGRTPTDHGPYNPNTSYGKKFCVTLFGCMWESLHDNNNTAPAVWDGGDTITPNLVDWKKVSGDYNAWLMNQNKPAQSVDYPFNGMGRVKLLKHVVDGHNLLYQDDFYKDGPNNTRVPNTNTVFEVPYEFELAENITIPDNCVLEFKGGSIKNGLLSGENIIVHGNNCLCTNLRFDLTGTSSVQNIKLIYNYTERRVETAIAVKSGAGIVDGCEIKGKITHAIHVEYGTSAIVRNNIVDLEYDTSEVIDNYETPYRALLYANKSDYIIIEGNVFRNIPGIAICGLELRDDVKITITNNNISKTLYGGIILMSSKVSGMSVCGNNLTKVNLSKTIDSTLGVVAGHAAINAHGILYSIVSENVIVGCYGEAIDIEGSDKSYEQVISDNPDATDEEIINLTTARGVGNFVSNNTVNSKYGIVISSCRNTVVEGNTIQTNSTQDSWAECILVYNSANTTISNNTLRSMDLNSVYCIKVQNFGGIATLDPIKHCLYENHFFENYGSYFLAVVGNNKVTAKGNIFENVRTEYSGYSTPDGGEIINLDEKVISTTLNTLNLSKYIIGKIGNYIIQKFIVSSPSAANVKILFENNNGASQTLLNTTMTAEALQEIDLQAAKQNLIQESFSYIEVQSNDANNYDVGVQIILAPLEFHRYF